MTDPRRQRFLPYFRALADRMQLRDWTLDISDDPPTDPENFAEFSSRYGQRSGRVWLGYKFLDASEEDQRSFAVHELVHAHFDVMISFVWKEWDADAITGPQWRGYKLGMELGTDAVALVIAPTMPLPSEVLDVAVEFTPNASP